MGPIARYTIQSLDDKTFQFNEFNTAGQEDRDWVVITRPATNRLDKLFKYSEQIVAIDGDQALKCLFESTWFYLQKCIAINGWIIT